MSSVHYIVVMCIRMKLFVISVLCTLYSCHVYTYEAPRDQCPVFHQCVDICGQKDWNCYLVTEALAILAYGILYLCVSKFN